MDETREGFLNGSKKKKKKRKSLKQETHHTEDEEWRIQEREREQAEPEASELCRGSRETRDNYIVMSTPP